MLKGMLETMLEAAARPGGAIAEPEKQQQTEGAIAEPERG